MLSILFLFLFFFFQAEDGIRDQEGNHLGPLVSDIQFGRVQAMIEKGIKEGAKLLVGGLGKPDGFDEGYWVRPTIFADANNKMAIAQEEIFGPVLTIIPFDSEEEAIEIANDTPYGLAAYVQSGDLNRAERVAQKLRVGMVHINGGGFNYGSPFGGYKQSGNGQTPFSTMLPPVQDQSALLNPMHAAMPAGADSQ